MISLFGLIKFAAASATQRGCSQVSMRVEVDRDALTAQVYLRSVHIGQWRKSGTPRETGSGNFIGTTQRR